MNQVHLPSQIWNWLTLVPYQPQQDAVHHLGSSSSSHTVGSGTGKGGTKTSTVSTNGAATARLLGNVEDIWGCGIMGPEIQNGLRNDAVFSVGWKIIHKS